MSPSKATWGTMMGLALVVTQEASAAEAVGHSAQDGFLWVAALGLALVHLSFPWLRPFLSRYQLQVTSLGGGGAIAYVFLHLLPELGERNEVLRGHIYGVVLVGFVLFYGLKSVPAERESLEGKLTLVRACLYNWLLIYGVNGAHIHNSMTLALATVALSMHLMHEDYILSEEHDWIFRGGGRYLLAVMPVLGLLSRHLFSLREDSLSSMVTALLAGVLMYNAFDDGLPSPGNQAAFGWFFTGVLVFSILALACQS